MRNLSWTRLNEGQMQFSPRQTSRDRFWTGFQATIYDTSGGFSQVPCMKELTVGMLVGPPIRSTCRREGAVSRRLQIPGDIDLIPLGFSGAWEDEGPTSFLCIRLSPSLVQTAAEGMDVNPDRVSMRPQLQFRDPQIEHIGWAIKAELEAGDPSGRLYADSLGLALAARLLRHHAPVELRFANGLPKRRLQRVVDYIHDHLSHDLRLAELAEVASLSPSHFKSLFKQSVGVPVHQFVIRSRVEYAIDLLLNGKLRLSHVALQAGFANQSHMARCMRRVTGLTPSSLRDLT
jgi:AraC family transcriptional regulator